MNIGLQVKRFFGGDGFIANKLEGIALSVVNIRLISKADYDNLLCTRISGRAKKKKSATSTVDSGSVPDQVEPKTERIGITLFC